MRVEDVHRLTLEHPDMKLSHRLVALLIVPLLALSAFALVGNDAEATQQGTVFTPDPWRPLTECESNHTVDAVSPSGTDFGLFQIQRATQLDVTAFHNGNRPDLAVRFPQNMTVTDQYELAELIRVTPGFGINRWTCGRFYASCFQRSAQEQRVCYNGSIAPGFVPQPTPTATPQPVRPAQQVVIKAFTPAGCFQLSCQTVWACPAVPPYTNPDFQPSYANAVVFGAVCRLLPQVIDPGTPNPQPSRPFVTPPSSIPAFTG